MEEDAGNRGTDWGGGGNEKQLLGGYKEGKHWYKPRGWLKCRRWCGPRQGHGIYDCSQM